MKVKSQLPPPTRILPSPDIFRVEDLILHGFIRKIDKNGPNGCWMWRGSIGTNGYGKFSFLSKTWLPHRVSWLLFRGPIGKKIFLCHKCDNPSCVNPDHLFLGTNRENIRDMVRKGRHGNGGGKPKLSPTNINFVRSSGLSNIKLAKMFNVTPPTIRRIKNGTSCKEIFNA